jgi:signal transduction histidine kinase
MSAITKKEISNFRPSRSYFVLFLCISVTISIALFISSEIRDLFKQSLKEKVQAIAQTAVLQIDIKDLDQIHGSESVGSQVYEKVVFALQALKMQNPSLRFVDIYRKTNEPNKFAYVADSNSIRPDIPVDDNGDGVINEEDTAVYPGDIYEAPMGSTLIENAFLRNDVADNLEQSQWGYTLDASSPIFDKTGKANYFLNVDVDVTEFSRQINLAFMPFWIFVIILIINLILLTISLVRMWSSRVGILQELDRQKDELISIVAHQLGTPVTSVKWYIEMLLDGDIGKLTDEQQKQLKTMQSVTVNLSDLVSMILDVSRLQLGKMKVDRTDLNLQEFFGEILAIMEPKAAEKKVKFVKSLPNELPTAMLDKRLMRMTLENLLSNAIKYTLEGGEVKLEVSVQGKMLKYSVRDTGCGIPKADQSRMFEKLYRATNVRKVDGNGFGLFVAKGAVEAQGGSIRFESTEGKGTTFFVELPLIKKGEGNQAK